MTTSNLRLRCHFQVRAYPTQDNYAFNSDWFRNQKVSGAVSGKDNNAVGLLSDWPIMYGPSGLRWFMSDMSKS